MSSTIATAESIATTRDFTVAVFVVHRERVLLHLHEKLNRWLPPGGHIEPNELPDEAAKREVFEETGVAAALVGESGISVTELGTTAFGRKVWTNTTHLGEPFHPENHCSDWTSSSESVLALTGKNAVEVEQGPLWDAWRAARQWTNFVYRDCDEFAHLYCFEDGDD